MSRSLSKYIAVLLYSPFWKHYTKTHAFFDRYRLSGLPPKSRVGTFLNAFASLGRWSNYDHARRYTLLRVPSYYSRLEERNRECFIHCTAYIAPLPYRGIASRTPYSYLRMALQMSFAVSSSGTQHKCHATAATARFRSPRLNTEQVVGGKVQKIGGTSPGTDPDGVVDLVKVCTHSLSLEKG